ncbi:hypothetical protein GALMADRAFT_219155 [Galerina marginata CBS 339.88]|uniref:Hydrophobin n=1 Tax=Galerina marginata (strain CBS 339.88) TaxID=685588 RepID=A0A067TSG2_GALM3|nr:hypothetical protein GALMADRAFT_219155 [Galerina marginata CBS 339.88]
MKLLQVVSLAIPLLFASPALSAASICCIETGGGSCARSIGPASSVALLADPTIELVNKEGKVVSPEACCCAAANSLNCRNICGP